MCHVPVLPPIARVERSRAAHRGKRVVHPLRRQRRVLLEPTEPFGGAILNADAAER